MMSSSLAHLLSPAGFDRRLPRRVTINNKRAAACVGTPATRCQAGSLEAEAQPSGLVVLVAELAVGVRLLQLRLRDLAVLVGVCHLDVGPALFADFVLGQKAVAVLVGFLETLGRVLCVIASRLFATVLTRALRARGTALRRCVRESQGAREAGEREDGDTETETSITGFHFASNSFAYSDAHTQHAPTKKKIARRIDTEIDGKKPILASLLFRRKKASRFR
jgi:hypothetical protein